ncbi:hypothetical protein Fisuc_0662 [Fibrobacter succinogenes subsp. succinogenes S85]|uniref:DUF2953 domain-containing protein n=1 Tax=Fibrobacter succinogenes (strain ATCC 19169 / S85) TaxID=59374 RepID=A0ABN3YVB8_FIBSS|nr:hypothetical protein Fisuc_0662 [Fibrobacter succinogenes subsp. succinogenes S85]
MGFLSWLFCVILVVALVLLLFPFAFRIDFEAGERGVRALFFFFKKKVYEYEKKWKEEAGSKELAVDSEKLEPQDAPPMVEAVAKKPAETPKTEHLEASDSGAGNESEPPTEVKSSSVVEVAKPDDEKPADEKKPKKEKRKLSDREFWTIILTPDFDARAFKYILKILKAVLSLFRVRFRDCFVEGVRTDYQTMGYIAAVNGFLKAYSYVGDWDLRMDWCNEKELRAAGSVHLSITLLRIFCFTLETLVLAGILAFSFWRRRAHVIKTNELPQLGFIRRRILEFILED